MLIVGLGQLGGATLDILLREAPFHDYFVTGRNIERVRRRMNTSLLVASQLGVDASCEAFALDLGVLDQTASLLSTIRPDIVFSAACLQSWWVIGTLPNDIFARIDYAQVGPWLPMHLTLVRDLMLALREADISAIVVNACFPDVVNQVLAKVGLAPTVGIGNLANNVPALRRSVATAVDAPANAINLRMIMHHYVSHRLSRVGDSGGAPFEIAVELEGADITDSVDLDTIIRTLPARYARLGGREGEVMTAASAASVLLPLIRGQRATAHCPGPNGLPGGYSVEIMETGNIELALPSTVNEKQAVAINEACHPFEGIDRVNNDGSVCFSRSHMAILNELLGYSAESMKPEESRILAEELSARYAAFAAKIGRDRN